MMRYPEKESSTLEWKRERPNNDQLLKRVIGFCNHKGGRIVIGVANTGEVVGISESELQKALESLDAAIYEAAYPTIIPRIYGQRLGEKSVLVIEVASGMSKPYYRKSEGLENGTYVRAGRSTVRATPEMIEELRWQATGLNFETLPNYRATRADLNEDSIQIFLDHRKNHGRATATDAVLMAYHLLVLEHSKFYPTQAALLLFGKRPQHFLSEARIICSQFQGISGRKTVATVDCEGTLLDQFQQAYSFILSRLPKAFEIRGPKRQEQLEIPEIAIREALLNAIIHRNYHIQAPTRVAIYDDRLEILSPGSFPSPLDPQNLRAGITYLRNPAICKVFRETGYVEKLGSGLIAIFEAYARRRLVDPQIVEGENYVKAILPRALKREAGERDELAELFALSSEISLDDVQKTLGVSRATASRRMNQWIKEGRVKRIGKTRSVRYRLKGP
jgi:ATP-dependent DNA helicase RecG